jgi:isocitrate dehydrogenase kinase/phosphatase
MELLPAPYLFDAGPPRLTDSRLANLAAQAIHAAFDEYSQAFDRLTRRAQYRFVNRSWQSGQADAAERLDLYKTVLDRLVADICELLDERLLDRLVWASMKAVYSSLIAGDDGWELAETFFNSVTRRIFTTVGVDPQIEFVDTDFTSPPTESRQPVYRTYGRADTAVLIDHLLQDYGVENDFAFVDRERDAALVAGRIEAHLRQLGALQVVERVEMVTAVFYRGKGAYLVGRLFSGSHQAPLALALRHEAEGVFVDAVLLTESAVSILFSFAHSYFHVLVKRPYDLVRFLRSLMPRKRVAELYISLGFNKHGKTILYRDLLHHLATSPDHFEIARGQRGMVMAVFTMPALDLVFKVIKDRFAPPKRTTRHDVMARYRLVFRHDRVGRLVDAQEFEHLQFARARFDEELLAELLVVAGSTVRVEGEQVVIAHCYVERRIIPLNLYVAEADPAAARAALVDYGQAIKDLALSNIFPGDMLLKNFGVTRHGRVVFYDYDELCLLTTCNFRAIPPARYEEDELSDLPWYPVGENDIFPEQFTRFLGVEPALRRIFMAHHADLLDPDYWCDIQARLRAGEVITIFPYEQKMRLPQNEIDE